MGQPVEVSVRSSLSKIIKELELVRDKSDEVSESFKNQGKEVTKEIKKRTKEAETFLGSLQKLGGRVADQLRRDFSSLISIAAISESLKISNQFASAAKETINLSDQIRKLGKTFGISQDRFSQFQAKLTKGLGEIGLSSDVASNSLAGLSGTRVRGEENLLGYSKTSGMLASLAGERGQESQIAGSIARVLQASGRDENNITNVDEIAESIRRVFVSTGALPTETLKSMETIFRNMPKDMRSAISSVGLANLASAALQGGPNATKFLEEYLGKSPIARMAFEAQGGKGVMTDQGIDIEKFRKFSQDIMGRVGGDPRLAAQTLGLSEDAAEGFVRLTENLDAVAESQDKVAKMTGDLNKQYKESLGLGESFKANINRVKKSLAEPLSWITQKGTDLLGKTAESGAGSTAVVAASGVLAALLAGIGLRGVGKGLKGAGKTLAKKEAAETFTGEKTVPVYVINADEIGGGMGNIAGGAAAGGLGKMGGAAGLLGKGGLIGAAIAAAIYGGVKLAESEKGRIDALTPEEKEKEARKSRERSSERGSFSGMIPAKQETRIVVETKVPNLKATDKKTGRGAMN